MTRKTNATWPSSWPVPRSRPAGVASCRWRRRPSAWPGWTTRASSSCTSSCRPAAGPGHEPGSDGFLVLEYVAGQTLHELYRQGRLEPRRLAGLVAAVAEAVHHAHTAGLVHRDLKPSNILIDPEGRPKVCDFGLAVDEEIQRLRRGEVAGTLPYMAPEQVRGETNRLDGRTDIWAIGVILYRGLTGALPFRGTTTAECFEEILGREPRPPRQFGDDIPRELERICLRCLSRQMSDRYLTAADLAGDLRRWLDDARTGPGRGAGAAALAAQGAEELRWRRRRPSSCPSCPASGDATGCPSRSDSGRAASRPSRASWRSAWACSTDPPGVGSPRS